MSFFDFMDYISNNIMMPMNAIGICLFAGWAWTESLRKEITNGGLIEFRMQPIWIMAVKIFAPAAIAVILVSGVK
jgi:NSS family neurotransmitter:Na+ symporter